jgi:hypothetical protein
MDRDELARQHLSRTSSVVKVLGKTTQCTDEYCSVEAQNKLRAAEQSRIHVRSGHRSKNPNMIHNMSNVKSVGKPEAKVEAKTEPKVKAEPKVEVKTQFRGMGSKSTGKPVPSAGGLATVSTTHANPFDAGNKSKQLARAIEEQAAKKS